MPSYCIEQPPAADLSWCDILPNYAVYSNVSKQMLLCHMSTMPSSAIMCKILAVGCCLSQHLCKQLQEPRLKSWGCSQHHRMTVAYLLTHFFWHLSWHSFWHHEKARRRRRGRTTLSWQVGNKEKHMEKRYIIVCNFWTSGHLSKTRKYRHTGNVFHWYEVDGVLFTRSRHCTARKPCRIYRTIPILSILTNQTKNEINWNNL